MLHDKLPLLVCSCVKHWEALNMAAKGFDEFSPG
jgi:hypothetical protein